MAGAVGNAEPEGIAPMGDEAVAAKVGIGGGDGIDLGPKCARRTVKGRHCGKAEPGVDADEHIARLVLEPVEHPGA